MAEGDTPVNEQAGRQESGFDDAPAAVKGLGAIVLAGGEARRLGGRSKPDLRVDGRRLLDIVLDATASAAPRVVVAGPEVVVPAGVVRVQEQPPRSGPAAGIVAGLEVLGVGSDSSDAPEWTLVLACDLPGAAGLVAALSAAVASVPDVGDGRDGAVLTHPDGTREWLTVVVRTASLAAAAQALGSPVDRSVRSLLAPLSLTEVPTAGLETEDIDTPADHAREQERRVGGSAGQSSGGGTSAAGKRSRPPVTQAANYATELEPWIRQACAAVGVDASLVDVDRVHTLTGRVAEGMERSMAPISAFIVGLALGQVRGSVGDHGEVSLEDLCARVEATLPEASP